MPHHLESHQHCSDTSAIIYHRYWQKALTVNRDLADIGYMLTFM